MDIFSEKSFEKALVVHCGVQLEAVLGIFRGLEGYQYFSIGIIISCREKTKIKLRKTSNYDYEALRSV